GLNRAVSLLAEKVAGGGRRGRATAKALKELGDHPEGGKITVRDGKYGPYVNHGKVNATLPKGQDPQEVTVAQALELIAARAGKTKTNGRARKAAPAQSKAEGKTRPQAKAKPKS